VPIQGAIEEAGLPDVLQLLALGRKTGCLTVADGTLYGEIYLDLGRVSFATVANRLDRLGDMLVKNGRITQQHLDAAIERQARGSKRQLGRILVDSGHIERGELERFVRIQVEEAVYFLFTRAQGTFTFTSDQRPPQQSLLVSLDPESLLLEGARRVDEWSLIQKKVPSFDLVYRRSKYKLSDDAAAELSEDQKRLLPLLDGTRDVTGLVDATGAGEFEVGKALYGLIMAGFAQLVERRAQIRHLDYRELLAYVVREAEYADAQRRRDAGRHIVDCPTCAERLRTIHVRRTEGSGLAGVSLEQLELPSAPVAAAAAPPVPLPPPPPPAPVAREPVPPLAPPVSEERRHQERRTGHDRRSFDRRTGLDRRGVINAAWAQVNVDRRRGPRREEERLQWPARIRREGDHERRAPAAARPARAVPTAPPGERVTGPRQMQTLESPAPDLLEEAPKAAPAAAAPSAAPPAPAPPAPWSTAQAGPPARPASPSQDLSWIVSPEESVEMIRASRSQLRPAVPIPAAVPAPVQIRAPGTPARRRSDVRAFESNGNSDAGPAGASLAAPASMAAPVRTSAPPRRGDVPPPVPRQPLPVRPLATAAVITAVALLSYFAGHRGTPAIPSPAAGPAATGAPVSTAQAQSPARTLARAADPAARRGTPARAPTEPRPATPRGPTPAPAEPPAAQAAAPADAPAPAPTVGTLRGIVHGAGGQPLAGARVTVRGTALAAVTDAAGAFEIPGVSDGPAALQVAADGYIAGSADVRARAGAAVQADVTLNAVPAAAEPDRELAAGGWAPVNRADATAVLGGTLGAIDGLPIESISQSTAGARVRVRVVQLTQAGERIALTETRAGAAVRGGSGPAVVTALRVMPPSEAYPWSTGTASLGNILITVKSSVAPDALRGMLERLAEAR
jgi:hypothetical protein